MGWEERNGKLYYYRKRRESGTVISEYIGRGPVADMLALEDETERSARNEERRNRKAEWARIKQFEQGFDNAGDFIKAITRAVLLVNGYHTHKGKWQKMRKNDNGRENHSD